MVLSSILMSAGLPILMDLIKSAGGAISRKWLGLSVDDQLKLDSAAVEKMKALAELDNPYGTPSQWIIDLRGSFRYVSAALLLVVGTWVAVYGASISDQDIITTGLELAGPPFGFIFGERLVLSYRGGAR